MKKVWASPAPSSRTVFILRVSLTSVSSDPYRIVTESPSGSLFFP